MCRTKSQLIFIVFQPFEKLIKIISVFARRSACSVFTVYILSSLTNENDGSYTFLSDSTDSLYVLVFSRNYFSDFKKIF